MNTKVNSHEKNVLKHKIVLSKIKKYKKMFKQYKQLNVLEEKQKTFRSIQSILDKFKQKRIFKPNKVIRLLNIARIYLNKN